jgi:membrane protease YdiL (CAAX protease family)
VRLSFALPGAVLSVFLLLDDRLWARVGAAVLLLDIVLHFLPWRVPRRDRGPFGYWLETVLYFLPMACLGLVGVALAEPWAVGTPDPVWFLAAPPLGASLVLLSGINLRGIVSGDLAFLAGPSKPSHAAARGTSAAVAPFGEEAFFRGAVIGLPGANASLAVLSAAAFVGRHHLIRGVPRTQTRVVLVELASAVSLTSLAIASGSIYPAVLAHLINNLPVAAINFQQMRFTRLLAEQGE